MGRTISAPLSGITAPPQHNGPGSNGYWQREMYLRAGTFTFTVKRDGWHKIDAVGAGESGSSINASTSRRGGAGGGRAISEVYLFAGDTVAITVGTGGVANDTSGSAGNPQAGTTTTVVCVPRSLSMTANGGGSAATSSGGTATGGDFNFSGGNITNSSTGGAAAPSHYADAVDKSDGGGGNGLGSITGHDNSGGDGSYSPGNNHSGGNGLTSRGGLTGNSHGEGIPFWDLNQCDGGGGAPDSNAPGNGGPGAGGGTQRSSTGSGSAGNGGILGGGGMSYNSSPGGRGGNGGGGGGHSATSSRPAGDGGDGCVFIFWNEVTPRPAP